MYIDELTDAIDWAASNGLTMLSKEHKGHIGAVRISCASAGLRIDLEWANVGLSLKGWHLQNGG